MALEDYVRLEWDLLLVEKDPAHRVSFAVEGWGAISATSMPGSPILAPLTSRESGMSRTGKILMIGPEVPPWYEVGKRVAFPAHSGTEVSLTSDSGRDLIILSRMDILMLFSGGEDSASLLDESWMPYAQATPGKLLAERVEAPLARGSIILPTGSKVEQRTAEAEVVNSHAPDFKGREIVVREDGRRRFVEDDGARGDLVLLGSGIGRFVPFGARGERRLYVTEPRQVLARLTDATDGIRTSTSPLRGSHDIAPYDSDDRIDEGDRRLPQ